MKNFNTEQTIKELEHIEQLLRTAVTSKRLAETGYFAEAHDKIRPIKKSVGELTDIPTLCNVSLSFPVEDTDMKKAEADMEARKKLLLPVAGVTALLLVIYFISHVDFLNTLSVIGIFASAAIGYLFFTQKKLFESRKKTYDESVAAYTRSMQAFRSALAQYEAEKARGTKTAEKYAVRYREGYLQSAQILAECHEKRAAAFKESAEALKEIEELDMIPPEYYHHVPQMILLLKSGRADDQKEALNMAIDMEHQEELEAQRRAEEERRIAAMERQAEEERRHNLQMERQQAEHDRAMERQAREQARRQEDRERKAQAEAREQAYKDREAARKAENKRRGAGLAKCANCANSRSCPSHVKESGGGLNCGGYRPR